MDKVGAVILTIGVCMADSENTLIPLVVVLTGMALMWRGINVR